MKTRSGIRLFALLGVLASLASARVVHAGSGPRAIEPGSSQSQLFPGAMLKLYRFNAGNFLSPCTTPNAVCCGGDWEIGPVNSLEESQGFGNARATVDSAGRLHLVLLHATALPNNTIPIPANFYVGPVVSAAMHYDSVIVRQGVYPVTYTPASPVFGEVSFNARLVGPIVPAVTPWSVFAIFVLLGTGGTVLIALRKRQGIA